MLEFGHNLGIRREVGRLFPYADRWWFPPMAAMLSAAATLSLTVPVGSILVALVALGLSGCGYITFRAAEENAQVGWSEVLNQYQRPTCSITHGPLYDSWQAAIVVPHDHLWGPITAERLKATH